MSKSKDFVKGQFPDCVHIYVDARAVAHLSNVYGAALLGMKSQKGNFPVTEDCNRYVLCNGEYCLSYRCPLNYVFHVTGMGNGKCVHDKQQYSACALIENDSATRSAERKNSKKSAFKKRQNIFSCPMDENTHLPLNGFHGDSEDCTKYYLCVDGTEYGYACPPNLYWSKVNQFCDVRERSTCSNSNRDNGNVDNEGSGIDVVSFHLEVEETGSRHPEEFSSGSGEPFVTSLVTSLTSKSSEESSGSSSSSEESSEESSSSSSESSSSKESSEESTSSSSSSSSEESSEELSSPSSSKSSSSSSSSEESSSSSSSSSSSEESSEESHEESQSGESSDEQYQVLPVDDYYLYYDYNYELDYPDIYDDGVYEYDTAAGDDLEAFEDYHYYDYAEGIPTDSKEYDIHTALKSPSHKKHPSKAHRKRKVKKNKAVVDSKRSNDPVDPVVQPNQDHVKVTLQLKNSKEEVVPVKVTLTNIESGKNQEEEKKGTPQVMESDVPSEKKEDGKEEEGEGQKIVKIEEGEGAEEGEKKEVTEEEEKAPEVADKNKEAETEEKEGKSEEKGEEKESEKKPKDEEEKAEQKEVKEEEQEKEDEEERREKPEEEDKNREVVHEN